MASASSSSTPSITAIDLDRLIQEIDDALSQKSSPQKNSRGKTFTFSDTIQPASADIAKFLEGLSQGAKMISDQKKLLSNLSAEAGKTAVGVLKQIGNLHMAATGFLVVATVLERFEKISSNQDQCLLVLKRLNDLAKCLKELKDRSGLADALDKKADEAILFIVRGAIMCLTQIGINKLKKFLLVSKNKDDLVDLDREILHFHADLSLHISTTNVVSIPTQFSPSRTALGIEDQVEKITKCLDLQSDKPALAVVVYGIGGIGKTTITDTVFHGLQGYKTCMICLKENADQNPSVETLQTQILEALTGRTYKISNCKIGQYEINKTLHSTKETVLLYIDNVLRREYVKEILPERLDSPNKFRLLLTARKTDVVETVESCGIEHCEVYEITPLAMDYRIGIICRNLDGERARNEMKKISQIAEKCSGIPLVLEVVGGYLRKAIKGKMELDQTLERVIQGLERGEPFSGNSKDMEYQSKLMFAYDDLTLFAKDAFLDISIFFNGWKWDEVGCIVGEEELRALEEGALVKKIGDKANVHDVLVGICRNKSKNVRIIGTEQLSYALQDQKITGEIKGIWLKDNGILYSDLSAEMLDKMHRSLRILALGGCTMIKGICKEKFENLRFLQAGDVANLPFDISMLDQLRFLDNGSGQHMGFNTPSQIPATLRVLSLCERSYCEKLEISPQLLANLRYLKSLKLQGFTNLFELPKCLGDLKALQELDLSACKGLTQLPETIVELQHLETLNLGRCINVKRLPANFGMLKSLRYVCLSQCRSLEELPESFGLLSSLQHLDLSRCNGICRLPSSFDQLVSLRVLDLTWCENLLYLPDNFGKLTSLVKLKLFSCHRLLSLPSSIGKLKSLSDDLDMSCCYQLKELPEEFCDLNLETLDLEHLRGLERLPDRFMELTRLKHLRMQFCQSLVRLPIGFGKLPVLEKLDLYSCIKLQELCSDFHCLPSLKKLILRGCVELDGLWMETVVKVSSLNFVDITGSCRLEDRWMELRETKDWDIIVNTDKDQDEDGRILKKAASMFFNDECSVFDCRGTPFKPSTLAPNTKLVLVFHCYIFQDRWKQLMENIQGLLKDRINDAQIIYIQKYIPYSDPNIQKRMEELEGTTLGLAPAYSKVLVAFDTLLSKVIGSNYRKYEDHVIITAVVDKDGTKQFSKWDNITHLLEERNFESENYLRFKRLQEVPQDRNTEILKSLLVTEGKDFLLLGNSKQVSIDSLQGKVVFLLVSRIKIFPMDVLALREMYTTASEKQNFEIIWMAIAEDTPFHYYWTRFMRTVESMPWPAMRDPWSIQPAALKVVKEDWNFHGSPMLVVVVDERGVITCNSNVKSIVERWGMEAYPFSTDQIHKLRMAQWDQIKAKSTLEVLFENFDCFGQVKKSMLQGRLICLCGGDAMQMLDFKSKLSSSAVNDAVEIIYVGRKLGNGENYISEEAIHERNRQRMSCLSLSFVEAWKFWKQIEYLLEDLEEQGYPESLQKYRVSLGIIDRKNYIRQRKVWIRVVDQSGEAVTAREGKELIRNLQLADKQGSEILMQAISRGEVEQSSEEEFKL